jgi:microcystin-dependent protein
MYGAGDGSTTFNIDNTMGRTSVGYDPLQTEFDALTDKGGSKTKSLTAAENGPHSHPFTGGHSFSWGTGLNSVYVANAIATAGNPPSNNLVTQQGVYIGTQSSGSGTAFSLMSPYYVSLKCVKI